jgi:hypothetical protein
MIALLIWLLVFTLIVYIAFWIVGMMGLPEPARRIALGILGLIFLLILLGAITGTVNLPGVHIHQLP